MMEKQLPHALAQLLHNRETGRTSFLLPFSLKEGIVIHVERSPNPDFAFALANAMVKQTLIPLADLWTSFPQDPASKLLAYSQANLFSVFLFTKCDQAWMEKLFQAYTTGLECEQEAKP